PDIAGTNTADPTAAVVSAAMMLDFLGETDIAARITKAVENTPSQPGRSTTATGDAIRERL
ncbi:MAG: isocitrate/isopropylmalate family dehydrogenase, partial [Acidimicrobiales bacterium]